MTIQEALTKADGLIPNSYSEADKVSWLSELDMRVKLEVFDTHDVEEIEFEGYTTDKDTVMLIPEPYSNAYIEWLATKINYYNAEYTRYNNSADRFNSEFNNFTAYYNRKNMPKQDNIIEIR